MMKLEEMNTITSGKQEPKERARRGRKRLNSTLPLGSKQIYFTVKREVYEMLQKKAESHNLELAGMVRNIVFEWMLNNL